MHCRHAWLAGLVALTVPLSAAAQRSTPVPAEVRAACDLVAAVMTKTPGTKVRLSTGSFADELLRAPVAGCRVDIAGSFKRLGSLEMPAERLRGVFDAQGWKELPDFSADGHDGTSFAYVQSEVACLARGMWDGGSDDRPDLPPADAYAVTVTCGSASAFAREAPSDAG